MIVINYQIKAPNDVILRLTRRVASKVLVLRFKFSRASG